MIKVAKHIAIIVFLLILITVSIFTVLGISQTGYINYENYFKNISSQTDVKGELNISVNFWGEQTEQKGIVVISKSPYMATLTIGLSSEVKEIVKITDIDFITKNGDVIISLDDCNSVYDSSKEEMIKEKEYFIQNDMYMNFNYEGLKLPDVFYIRISYICGNNLKERTMLLKKSKKVYLTVT